jgi:hypothetical protein
MPVLRKRRAACIQGRLEPTLPCPIRADSRAEAAAVLPHPPGPPGLPGLVEPRWLGPTRPARPISWSAGGAARAEAPLSPETPSPRPPRAPARGGSLWKERPARETHR